MGSEQVDSRTSWKAAWMALAILSVTYGSPLVIVVGMKTMQAELGTGRSLLALAGALVWVGTGAGGIFMGWLADRIGVRATVAIGATMIAGGLALSSIGTIWALYVGHGLMLGLFGNGGVYPPLLVYVSRWFERRRGAAIALISSGQYVAGVVWPALFERGIASVGWQAVMLGYAGVVLVLVLPLTFCPSNTVQTDGRLLLINQNQALFSLFGTRYGGDGVTTFVVPNLKAPLSGNRQPMMSCVTLTGIFPAQN